ncbi:MAG: hypothetical protein C4534_08795 [Gaiellales bacterium]|nr:MAG: hypothetical protein C4534_08795 [Gaiellales bacterium]
MQEGYNKTGTDYFIQRVVLAEGQIIDLVCFEDNGATDNVIKDIMNELQKKKLELQTCPLCKSNLVYPVERSQVNDAEWKVLMLCPNCLCKREMVVDRETVRELLKNARVGRESLMKELDSMQKKNMEEEAEKFISALNRDHILPIDF